MIEFVSFDEAVLVSRTLGIKNRVEYRETVKNNKNLCLPYHPEDVYDEFTNYSDLLGTSKSPNKVEIMPFNELFECIRKNGIYDLETYKNVCDELKLYKNVDLLYKDKGFLAWSHLFIDIHNYFTYKELIKFMNDKEITSKYVFNLYLRSGDVDKRIPTKLSYYLIFSYGDFNISGKKFVDYEKFKK